MGLHNRTTTFAIGHKIICFFFFGRRWLGTVEHLKSAFFAASHVQNIAMNLLNFFCKAKSCFPFFFQFCILSLEVLTVKVIYILSNNSAFFNLIFVSSSKHLEVKNGFVSLICFAFSHELNKIIVPMPSDLRVLQKIFHCKYYHRIALVSVLLAPKTISTTEGWNATSCTQTCTSQDHNIFGVFQIRSSFFSCNIYRMMFKLNFCLTSNLLTKHRYLSKLACQFPNSIPKISFKLLKPIINILCCFKCFLDFFFNLG